MALLNATFSYAQPLLAVQTLQKAGHEERESHPLLIDQERFQQCGITTGSAKAITLGC